MELMNRHNVFGLYCLCAVPIVLKFCSELIETFGVVDGIYRLSGISSNIQRLRFAVCLVFTLESMYWCVFRCRKLH